MNKKVTEAQIYLTRKCNLRCGSCALVKNSCRNEELTITGWEQAFKNMGDIGIETLKIMGGEPTMVRELPELLKFLNEQTSLRYAVLSNSLFSDDIFNSIVDAKMQGYFASVDGIGSLSGVDSDADKKSRAGFKMLKRFRDAGIELLGANVVITSKNLRDIPEIVGILSSEGIWINLCPIIYDTTGGKWKWEYRTSVPSEFLFTDSQTKEIGRIMSKILGMKGIKLGVPNIYLENMAVYGIRCNWKCGSELAQLRIDADGRIMLCNDIRGDVAEKYNILDINPIMFEELKKVWTKERKRTNCPGCYWSAHFRALYNIKNGLKEFDYYYSSFRHS